MSGYSAAREAYPAVAEHQARLNRHYRAILDNAAMTSGPQIVLTSDKPFRLGETRLEGEPQRFTRTALEYGPPVEFTEGDGAGFVVPSSGAYLARGTALPDIENFSFTTTAKEDTMAKRQTKAQRNAARREKYAAKRPRQAQDGPTDTGDEAPAPTTAMQPPPNIESLASFIGAYMLFQLGFELNEIGELFCTSTMGAGDRVKTGQFIAERNGLSFGNVADRNRAMRQNKFGDFARKAATAMQERIALALPAFIRTAEVARVGNDHGIVAVVKMVNRFDAEDVVANIPIPNQGDVGKGPYPGAVMGMGSAAGDPRARPTLQRDTGSSKY